VLDNRAADLELEGERPDQRHHQQRADDRGHADGVAQARAQLPVAAAFGRDRVQAPGVEGEQRGDDEAEDSRLDHEAPADTDRTDHTAAMVGPITRATFTAVLFSVTALRIRSRPTTSWTNACRAGLSTALRCRTPPRGRRPTTA
jgi:hypothetical protein